MKPSSGACERSPGMIKRMFIRKMGARVIAKKAVLPPYTYTRYYEKLKTEIMEDVGAEEE